MQIVKLEKKKAIGTLYSWVCITAIFIMAVGCKKHSEAVFPENETLPMEVKTGATKLRASVILDSYDFVRAKAFYVYRDSIMVIVNNPSNDYDFLELYNLNSHKLIKSFLKKGNGPGEMLNVSPFKNDAELLMRDFVKRNLYIVDLDAAVSKPDYRVPAPLKYGDTMGSPFVSKLDEKRLIMLNPYYFVNKSLGIDNKEPRFIFSEIGRPINKPLDKSDKYYAYNVSQGMLVVNKGKDRLVYASSDYAEIEIYDCSLNPLTRIEGPDEIIPSYRLDTDKSICYNKVIPYSYMDIAYTEEYLYLCYIGDYFGRNDKLTDLCTYILKFDWDGHYLDSFDTGHYVDALSVGANAVLYGSGYDDDGTRVLWRLERE